MVTFPITKTAIDPDRVLGDTVANPKVVPVTVLGENQDLVGLSASRSIVSPHASVGTRSMSGTLSVQFIATGSIIRRTVGSWIDDGFLANECQFLYVEGASNFSNNLLNTRITEVTATDLTVEALLVNEGPVTVTLMQSVDTLYSSPLARELPYGGAQDVWIKASHWQGASEHSENDPHVANALNLTGGAVQSATRTKISGWRGVGAMIGTSLCDSEVYNCYIGVQTRASDIHILRNIIWACRDYGLHIRPGNAQIQSTLNHIYGVNGLSDGTNYDGMGVFLEGGGCVFSADTYEANHYGMFANGAHYVRLVNCRFQRNSVGALLIQGLSSEWKINGCEIEVPVSVGHSQFDDVYGVKVSSCHRIRFNNTGFYLSGVLVPGLPEPNDPGVNYATGLKIESHGVKLTNCEFQDFGAPSGKARGIHIVSAVKGFKANPIYVWGFNDSGDRLVDVENTAINGLSNMDIEVHGNSSDTGSFPEYLDRDAVAQYLKLNSGWNDSNRIKFINDATGQEYNCVPGLAY